MSEARFSFECSLADVDAGLALDDIARRAAERGYLFPLPRPLPPLTLADACAALPILVDSFVSSAEGETPEGARFTTGRAPRAATGPDLLGALCTEPPLARCTRARVRVLDSASARLLTTRHLDLEGALASWHALMEAGRAFTVDVFRVEGGFVVRALGAPGALASGALPGGGDDDGGASGYRSARALVPADLRAVRSALTDGERVFGAPQMGRAAVLSLAPARSPRAQSAAGLARALVKSAAGRIHG